MATTNFGLVELEEGQAGNDIRYNETLAILDILIKRTIEDITLTAPPGSPVNGTMYWINSLTPTGAWASQGRKLALYIAGGWVFLDTPTDAVFFVKEGGATDNRMYRYGGTSWTLLTL